MPMHWLTLARFGAAGLAVWAIGRQPYDFYMLVRWIVCLCAAYTAYLAFTEKRRGWAWVLVALAVVCNPIERFYLDRTRWAFVNGASAAILVGSCFVVPADRRLILRLGRPTRWTALWSAAFVWVVITRLVPIVHVIHHGHEAPAVVEETWEEAVEQQGREGTITIAEYAFHVRGVRFTGRADGPHVAGQIITIEYDPHDPRHNREGGDRGAVLGYIMVVVGLAFLAYVSLNQERAAEATGA